MDSVERASLPILGLARLAVPSFPRSSVPKLRLGTRSAKLRFASGGGDAEQIFDSPFPGGVRGRGDTSRPRDAKRSFAAVRSQTEFGNEGLVPLETADAGALGAFGGRRAVRLAAPAAGGTFVLMSKPTRKAGKQPEEIAVVGEVDDWESEVVKALLEVPPGGECVFYIDSAGGSVFGCWRC